MRVCAILLCCLPAIAGSLEGRVTDSVTGAGLQGVTVVARRQGVIHDATTDEGGRFRIENLPDGEYLVRYEKEDYDVGSVSRLPLVTVSGDTRTQEVLIPFANLRGRVTGADGEPMAGATVRAMPSPSVTVTAADGEFEFVKLHPGSYTLSATAKDSTVTTYFRSTVDDELAERIEVAGVDLFGYEVRLKTAAVHTIHGVVTGLDGKPAAHAVVTLMKPGSGPVTWIKGYFNAMAFPRLPEIVNQVETAEDGTFQFDRVLEGVWRVQAQTAPDYDYQRHTDVVHGGGGVNIDVSNRELDSLQIRLAPTFELEVTVDWGDQAASHPRFRFNVVQMDDMLAISQQADVEQTHRIGGFLAGRHFFEPGQFPTPGYYLARALLNGQDVLGKQAEILGPGTLRLVYKSDGGTVRGTVLRNGDEKAQGALVLLMAEKPDGSRVGYSAWSAADGGFAIADVPPGDYSIVALVQAPSDVKGAEFESALAQGERVRVETGSTSQFELRVR